MAGRSVDKGTERQEISEGNGTVKGTLMVLACAQMHTTHSQMHTCKHSLQGSTQTHAHIHTHTNTYT